MAENSKIEWTHHTFNAWRGCTKVSEGCAHCYADTLSKRNPRSLGVWGPRGTRPIAAEAYWRQPLAWDRAAAAAGERRRVFCSSLADVFEGPETMPAEAVHEVNEARKRLFDLVTRTPQLDWLLLTKRPENALQMMIDAGLYAVANPSLPCPQPNLWIGTSVENQATADERIPHLLRCPAAVRFLSMEPLLGAVDLLIDGECSEWACHECGSRNVNTEVQVGVDDVSTYQCLDCKYSGGGEDADWKSLIDWVIVGGESGPGARPMHPAWARSIRDQCAAAAVPFFFKQWGEWSPIGSLSAHQCVVSAKTGETCSGAKADFPAGACSSDGWQWMYRVGKAAAGRLLDGREHNDMPAGVSHAR